MKQVKEMEMELVMIARRAFDRPFKLLDLDSPGIEMQIMRTTDEWAREFLLSIFLPAELIDETREEGESIQIPASFWDYLKSAIKQRLPFLGRWIKINQKQIVKTQIIKKYGIHPSFFNTKSSLGRMKVVLPESFDFWTEKE